MCMSITELSANQIFRYIVGDFQDAWNALTARPGKCIGGGNYMFALLAMILLEFASRVCTQDSTGKKLKDLTKALAHIDDRYFIPIPGTCEGPPISEFTLPGQRPQSHLLGMMFDLIRNGKAHQYSSAIVTSLMGA